MILVTGHLLARPETLERLLELSLEHVRRSRREPGCLQHGVHRDVEDPLRLVFFERWTDRAALDAHFALAASREFVHEATALAAGPPSIEIYEVDAG